MKRQPIGAINISLIENILTIVQVWRGARANFHIGKAWLRTSFWILIIQISASLTTDSVHNSVKMHCKRQGLEEARACGHLAKLAAQSDSL